MLIKHHRIVARKIHFPIFVSKLGHTLEEESLFALSLIPLNDIYHTLGNDIQPSLHKRAIAINIIQDKEHIC